MPKETNIEIKNDRLVFRGTTSSSITPIIDDLKKKGWTTVTASGDSELRRALWLEGSMRGLFVKGYEPTNYDKELLEQMSKQKREGEFIKMRASDVAQDFSHRVIPKLQREYDERRRYRRKAGITTTELDRAYGLNSPQGYSKDIDDRFFRVKAALVRALSDSEEFRSLGNRIVTVKQSFEDGVTRFVLVGEGRTSGLSHDHVIRNRRR